MPLDILTNKVVMIVASRDFRDEELFVTKEILETHGINIVIASDTMGIARGVEGGEEQVDLTLDRVQMDDFDAVVFVGGPGALKHLDNRDSYEIAQSAIEHDKVLGAICIAPLILAKAVVLQNRNATVFSSDLDKSAIKVLQENGAIYVNQRVVTDGKLITANSAEAAQEFGEALVDALKP